MAIFMLAMAQPNPDNKLNRFMGITGNVIDIDTTEGCVTNVLDDGILNIIRDRIDYSKKNNLVVIKGFGDYYLLEQHTTTIDSFGRPYKFEKGDLICYDLSKLPPYVEI